MSIPEEAVEAGWEQARADAGGYPYPEREEIRRILEAAAPHMLAGLAAEVAYQTARAEYFRYAPESEFDPEGVKRLRDAMRAAREALKPSE